VVRASEVRNTREMDLHVPRQEQAYQFPLALFVNTQGYMDVCLENVLKHFSN